MGNYRRLLLDQRAFAIVASTLLSVSTLLAPTVNARTIAKEGASNPIPKSFKQEAPSKKVSKKLQTQFKDQEQVTFRGLVA
jgi:hypothetical protein